MIRRFALLAVSLVALLGGASTANAGTYDMYVCKGSDGTLFGTSGWVALNPQPNAFYDLGCEDGHFGVSAGSTSASVPAGFRTGWQFTLPKPLTITSIDADYLGSVTEWKGWSTQIWGRRHDQPQWLDISTCEGENCGASFKDLATYGMGSIAFGIRCGPSQACPAGSYADMEVSYLKLRLNDPQVPHVDSLATRLANHVPISGVTSVAFSASDAQSGVRFALLEVDGRAVASRSFDTDARTCRAPFTRIMPCPARVAGTLNADTTVLKDGPHLARLLIYDATATNAAVAGPWSFTTNNRQLYNLCAGQLGPSARVRLKPRTVAFGRGSTLRVRWPTAPWAPAEVALLTGRRHLSVSRSVPFAASHVSILDVPRGHNRVIRAGIRPSGSTGPFACSKPLTVRVRPRVRLRAKPRLLENGHTVRLRGRISGKGARGRAVVLEARARGGRRRWTPVTFLHAGRHGRFRFSYRFARTYQRTRYVFRARVPRQRGFPYAPGHSRRVRVLVAP